MKLRLVQTCGACPEQYDVFHGEKLVGFMRLRHGYFRAEYYGEVVYDANPEGDGVFEPDERAKHLNAACAAIIERLEGVQQDNLFTVEYEEQNDRANS